MLETIFRLAEPHFGHKGMRYRLQDNDNNAVSLFNVLYVFRRYSEYPAKDNAYAWSI